MTCENAAVSYDLAIWEGDRPADDKAAREEYLQLYDRYVRSRGPQSPPTATASSATPPTSSSTYTPPTPRIAAYVSALLHRYPDIDSEAGEDSPWADAPLIGDASGPFLYFPMVYSQCDEASAWASQLAAEHGLVCYDPQLDKLRP